MTPPRGLWLFLPYGEKKMSKFNAYIKGRYAHVNKNDVVFTPDWLAKKICSMFPIKGSILEPCKGEGVFLKYLPESTDWCEIADGKNFYDYEKKIDWIVTNPPYSDFNRFLDHSFKLADNVIFLVPVAKFFKSMGTLKKVFAFGNFVEIHTLSSSKAGFPFGFPSAIYYIKKNYKGAVTIKMLEENCNNLDFWKKP